MTIDHGDRDDIGSGDQPDRFAALVALALLDRDEPDMTASNIPVAVSLISTSRLSPRGMEIVTLAWLDSMTTTQWSSWPWSMSVDSFNRGCCQSLHRQPGAVHAQMPCASFGKWMQQARSGGLSEGHPHAALSLLALSPRTVVGSFTVTRVDVHAALPLTWMPRSQSRCIGG
jgi:hypothetical protein